ncbi:MAG TPA: helix-turn-helix domain-containing protein [Nitriliruptorales bacterium]|nr:helix-turn-helix domain-containing protein [Nitriliruptorales bacterium]
MVAEDYPPVLDAAMVAELLGMNIDTVRRLSREGVLPAHRVPGGRTFKYLRDELLEWLRAQPANNPAGSKEPVEERRR